jgi:amino acid transporter
MPAKLDPLTLFARPCARAVTVGAGIYVLIGAAAAHSAMRAPAAFAIAALLMALTAASFADSYAKSRA